MYCTILYLQVQVYRTGFLLCVEDQHPGEEGAEHAADVLDAPEPTSKAPRGRDNVCESTENKIVTLRSESHLF